MSKVVVTQLVDDLDNNTKANVETITFSVDGEYYEIDLKPRNKEKLKKALRPFIDNARVRGPYQFQQVMRGKAPEIRQWAKDRGYLISENGRIPQEVLDAYNVEMSANSI